ncbi:MAG: hypothetical protein WBD20_18070 [Pirellulaceae bacterium]
MKKQLITGLIGEGGARVFRARANDDGELTARVWFPLTKWRVNDGPVQDGELKLWHVGAAVAPTGNAWTTILRQGRLIRTETWFEEKPHAKFSDQGDWHFGEIELDPIDDADLSPLAIDVMITTTPTEDWHVQPLAQRATASGAKGRLDELKATINIPADSQWSEPSKVFIGPDTVMGWGTVAFAHSTHGQNEGLGRGKDARILLRYADNDVVILHTFRSAREGNDCLGNFLHDLVKPAAIKLGIDFKLTLPEVVIPDSLRVEPVDVPDVGVFFPYYAITFDQATGEPNIQCSEMRSEPIACPAFSGRQIRFTIQRNETKLDLVGKTVRSFLDLGTDEQQVLLDDASQRLWKMKHKKRRPYDPDDAEAVEELWNEIGIGALAQVNATSISCWLSKFGKDFPMEMKVTAGRVKKLS